MSKKYNGVLYIKYKDDEEAKNGRGIAVHLYQDVKHYGFLSEGINLLKIELDDINREAVYIPMSNIALIEYYEKYNNGVIMGKKKSYIPKGAINTCNVYESKDAWENHLNELFNKRMLEND